MRITITKGGIFGGDGKEIPVGTELTVKDPETHEDGTEVAPHPWAGRFEVISGGAEAKAKGGKKAVTNPAKDPVKYEAKAKGDQFVITDSDGKEYGEPLTEADAGAFNALSEDDKAAFVADQTKA